jgi:hypothetical protein
VECHLKLARSGTVVLRHQALLEGWHERGQKGPGQRFEQKRDPNAGLIERDWFVAALVDLACQLVRYGLPVLISVVMPGARLAWFLAQASLLIVVYSGILQIQ